MAEGILRAAASDIIEVQSAGTKPAGFVHPLAIRVMAEIGIDISEHRSKHLNEFLSQPVETVIMVCAPSPSPPEEEREKRPALLEFMVPMRAEKASSPVTSAPTRTPAINAAPASARRDVERADRSAPPPAPPRPS